MSAQRAYRMPSELSLMSEVREMPTTSQGRSDTSMVFEPYGDDNDRNTNSLWGFDDYIVFYVK